MKKQFLPIRLLLLSILFTLLSGMPAMADRTPYGERRGTERPYPYAPRTIDGNQNKISDALELQMANTLDLNPINVLVTSTDYQYLTSRLSNQGIAANLISRHLGILQLNALPEQIRWLASFNSVKLIEGNAQIKLSDEIPSNFPWRDGQDAQSVSKIDPELVNAKKRLAITGGDSNKNVYSKDSDQVIAIIDSGIDSENFLLNNGKIIYRKNFVDNDPNCPVTEPTIDTNGWDRLGHGTRVASIAAGNLRTKSDFVSDGVAPGAAIIDLKVFGCDSSTTTSVVIKAMEWVIDNALAWSIDVVNMSLGAAISPTDGTYVTEILANMMSASGVVEIGRAHV